MNWLLEPLFSVTESEEKRISEVIAAIERLSLVPGTTWKHTVSVNGDHLRMWLITSLRPEGHWFGTELPQLTMSDEKLLALWIAECAARNHITEIERCAATILMRTSGMIGHGSETKDERVVRWIFTMCTHANAYSYGPDGIHANGNDTSQQLDYAEYYKGAIDLESIVLYSRDVDDNLLNLGGALASYRSEKRPVGDQTTTIDTMSGISVTSSLAAAIAEYHQHMMNAMYERFNRN